MNWCIVHNDVKSLHLRKLIHTVHCLLKEDHVRTNDSTFRRWFFGMWLFSFTSSINFNPLRFSCGFILYWSVLNDKQAKIFRIPCHALWLSYLRYCIHIIIYQYYNNIPFLIHRHCYIRCKSQDKRYN
jgi:hypothetical protein